MVKCVQIVGLFDFIMLYNTILHGRMGGFEKPLGKSGGKAGSQVQTRYIEGT